MRLEFNPNEIFPLFSEGKYSYEEEKLHAERVDQFLGFCFDAEKTLRVSDASNAQQEFWVDLPVQSLQTPYTELRRILNELALQSGDTVVDLGCGYARMAFVIDQQYSDVNFVGIEAVAGRCHEAKRITERHSLKKCQIVEADLMDKDFELPDAKFYFIYDFGSESAIEEIMQKLREMAQRKSIVVIGRGRRTRQLIHLKHPWLCQVVEPKHFQNFSIYFS